MVAQSLRSGKPIPWTALGVALGLALRAYHYLRDPSVWGDEAVVILNVLRKGFGELLGTLTHAEAAPPLFLWIEKCAGLLLGDSTFAWRLPAFLASCAALLLLVPLARWVLRREAVPWAVFLFACSDRLLWHCCEAKPYAIDVLCATTLLVVYCGTRMWPLNRQLLVYAVLTPVLIFLSFPGSFLSGGLLLSLLPAVWRAKRLSTWLAYGGVALAVLVAFGLLLLGPVRAQRGDQILWYWQDQLPDWGDPWSIPTWSLARTFGVCRYCLRPTGGFLAGFAVIGGGLLWRGRQRRLLCLLVVPVALALLASYMHYYPYGHARVEVYATPALVLLIAAGILPVFSWISSRGPVRVALIPLVVLLLSPLALTAYRIADPWDRPDAAGAVAYVRAHKGPEDLIASEGWVYGFYLRDGSLFHPSDLPRSAQGEGQRVWLIAEGSTSEFRQKALEKLPPANWQILECCCRYKEVDIYVLTRFAPASAPN